VAAGLGGGSSDAAAALLALEDISALPLGPERLSEIGAGVGCDVPALLAGGPALVAGRGEQVSAASSPSAPTWWAIRPLDVYVAAADAYAWWDQDGGPTASPRGAAEAVDAFATGDLERLGTLLRNDLQGPVSRRHPEVAETIAAFERAGSLGVIMSGSGPTVVALARDETDARRLAAEVAGADAVSTPVSTVSRPPFTGDAGPEGRFA
jgi:4-diphosphocytidyl-2C-methyl-D-erythritol kinase